jgi:hypothetical protein
MPIVSNSMIFFSFFMSISPATTTRLTRTSKTTYRESKNPQNSDELILKLQFPPALVVPDDVKSEVML